MMKKIVSAILLFVLMFLQVKAQPSWSVVPENYNYTMTFVGVINLNYVESVDTQDKIAAFVNGECRAVGSPVYDANFNRYFVYLVVYSNTNGETINFKAYKQSTNTVTDILATKVYAINQNIGNQTIPYVWSNPTLSSEAVLLTYNLAGQLSATVFDGKNIKVQMPYGSDITNQIANFTTSQGAAVRVNNVAQTTGVTPNDFTNPLVYQITSADATSTDSYTVSLEIGNSSPTDVTISNSDISEIAKKQTLVGKFTTSDIDPNPFKYSLVSGAGDTDNSKFYIEGENLYTNSFFDFETQSSLSIRVKTDDEKGGVFEKQINLNVIDFNEDISLSKISFSEIHRFGTSLGQITYNDNINGPYTYTFTSGIGGEDNSKFTITADSVFTAYRFDFESKNSFFIKIKAVGESGRVQIDTVKITILDFNEEITLSNYDINEIKRTGTAVGQIIYTDKSNAPYTFSLVTGDGSNDNSKFVIDQDSIRTNSILDYETKQIYSVRIKALDNWGRSFENTLTINILDFNEEITLSNYAINEIKRTGTAVGQIIYTDKSNAPYTFSLVTGAGSDDNSMFVIDQDSIRTNSILDYETKQIYSVRIKALDNWGRSFENTLTITILDFNEEITLSNYDINEIKRIGTAVGQIIYTDKSNAPYTFSLVAGIGSDDNSKFVIDQDSIRTKSYLDYETKQIYSVRIKALDNWGRSFENTLTINALDYIENIRIDNDMISEFSAPDSKVGKLISTDAVYPANSFELVTGTGDSENEFFRIENDILYTKKLLDFELKEFYSIRIKTTNNNGRVFYDILIITVKNEAEDIFLNPKSVKETSAVTTVIGRLSTSDYISNSFVFTLVAGEGDTDNFSFKIVGDELQTTKLLDYEKQNNYSIRLKSVSNFGIVFYDTLIISVIDENDEFPIATKFTTIKFDENLSPQIVHTIVSSDNDFSAAFKIHQYFQETTTQDTNFSINPNTGEISVLYPLDFDLKSEYPIKAYVTDGVNKTEIDILFALNDLNDETPQMTNPITINVSDVTLKDTEVFEFVATDRDANSSLTYTLSNDFSGTFELSSDGILTLKEYLDFDQVESYQFQVTVSDGLNQTVSDVVLNVIYTDRTKFTANKIISPNGDNYLDYWLINNEMLYRDARFQIFNSNGLVVFDQIGYLTYWDGTNKGVELPIGAYYYIITTSRGESIKGTITLIK